ncbi:ATP-binding protein [Paraburkholderia acidisoli]|uniref:ATP-binding protein n=1 Tax=Paraburkholderia acidisoli TaxID=2571748 RepID=UPI00131B0FD8|nr:ATP-binding protein [Paraburkholderia acidisoli]
MLAKHPLGLTTKLFVAMVVVNIVLIGAMSLGARISFEHGFLGYLEQQDIKRLDASVAPLEAAYREHGSWAFLRANRHVWHQLMLPNPRTSLVDSNFPPPPIADLVGANLRFSLLDANGAYLSGNREIAAGAPRRPVVVDGKTVGWLVIVPVQEVTEAGDLRLQRTQRDASWALAVAAMLTAVMISLWIARALGLPLQRIARATHVLAGGDFQARIPVVSAGELGQLEADFNNLAQTLERNERVRAALFADISHELRTPLAVIRGEVEALEVGVREMSTEAMRSLSTEVARLNRLVDDLYQLSLSDVGALRYHFGLVDVAEAMEEVLSTIRRPLAEARIALTTDLPGEPCWVHGDERRLQQVFFNIFQNVLRYVPEGAAVQVRIRQDAARIHIDILDSGPGVPDTAHAALFDRFYRVEGSRSRSTGGAGLGLPICKSIMEAHRGAISAARAPQGGLWIAIQLPCPEETP